MASFNQSPPSSSCCPPSAHPSLGDTYVGKGEVITIKGGAECYVVRSSWKPEAASQSCRGVVLFPDIFGFAGGRTRGIADGLVENRTADVVVVPKMLSPPLERGTEGDGLPADFNLSARKDELVAWLTRFTWENHLAPRARAAVQYVKTLGGCKIAVLGFCFGAAVGALMAAEDPRVSCAVFAHPSLHWIPKITDHQGSARLEAAAVAADVRIPTLVLPAGDDSDTYKPGGEIASILQQNSVHTQVVVFPAMRHGFVTRGPIHDPAMKRDVTHAMDLTVQFLQDQFQRPPRLRLTYFHLPGRAEMTRLALTVGGMDFEDRRVSAEEWKEIKSSGKTQLNQLPMLEVDGHRVCQSKAIVRYAGQITGLYPTDPFSAAQVDMVLDMLFDRLQLFTPTMSVADPEARFEARRDVLSSDEFKRVTQYLNQRVETNHYGYVVGPSLTVADLALYADHSALLGGWIAGIGEDFLEPYKHLVRHRHRIASLPRIKSYYSMISSTQRDTLRRRFKPDPIVIGYWASQGRAAGLRMMAMFARQPIQVESFTEDSSVGSVDGKSWWTRKAAMKLRNPLSNLPFIIDGTRIISQSIACYAYLGRKFGLWGRSESEEILCEELLGELADLRHRYHAFLYDTRASDGTATGAIGHETGDSVTAASEMLVELKAADGYLQKIERTLEDTVSTNAGSGTFLVNNHPTAPDFHLYTILEQFVALQGFIEHPDAPLTTIGAPPHADTLFQGLPRLQFFFQTFGALPEHQEYFKSPLHLRMPFNNKGACFGANFPELAPLVMFESQIPRPPASVASPRTPNIKTAAENVY